MSTVVFANRAGGGYGNYGGGGGAYAPPGKKGKLPAIVFGAVALFFCSVCVAYVFNLGGLRDTITWIIGFDPLSFMGSPGSTSSDSAPVDENASLDSVVSTDGADVPTDNTDAGASEAGTPDPSTGKCSDGSDPKEGSCPASAAQSGKTRGTSRTSRTSKTSKSDSKTRAKKTATSKPAKRPTIAPSKSSSAKTTATGPSRPVATSR